MANVNKNNTAIKTKTLDELAGKSDVELANRYLAKRDARRQSLKDAFFGTVNLADKEDNYIYSALAYLEGDNLNYIYTELFVKRNSLLTSRNSIYKLKVEAIVEDIDNVLQDNIAEILKVSTTDGGVADIVKELVKKYNTEILSKAINLAITNNKTVDD